MRILIATDAWHPQVNGVVRSLEQTASALLASGVQVEFLTPQDFRSLPLPSYPEIRLALALASTISERLDRGRFDAIHIATEGPIGLAVRRVCMRRDWPFTTSYHTRFPEYLSARLPVPEAWSYAWLRRFHNASATTMVSTPRLRDELASRGFERLGIWSRGVDTTLFHPRKTSVLDLPRPIYLYVGRLAVEKNIEAFLDLHLNGSKVVVGEGPLGPKLRSTYPEAVFLGLKSGQELADVYASADVFVFPSRTDTFGIVLLEALASGVPVAALPVPGPLDVISGQGVGVLDEDLRRAALAAFSVSRMLCREFAMSRSWSESAQEFLTHVKAAAGRASLPPATRQPDLVISCR
jgi:glycosyltransferase involved in cell wall biosynthesis